LLPSLPEEEEEEEDDEEEDEDVEEARFPFCCEEN